MRVHPETGRKALYIGEKVTGFVGMTEEESRPLIDYLVRHATRPQFVYRHQWRPNDIVLWDNRCTMHIALGDYEESEIAPPGAHDGEGHAVGLLPAMKRASFPEGRRCVRRRRARGRARASAWPDRQIRMVIPFAAGGTTDLLARAVGQHMTQAWGQPVVTDNRAGANGIVAAEIVAKSAADGYTLLFVAMGHAINPLIYKKLPYDGTRISRRSAWSRPSRKWSWCIPRSRPTTSPS